MHPSRFLILLASAALALPEKGKNKKNDWERYDKKKHGPIGRDGDISQSLIGDGSPYQQYLYRQLTPSLECYAGECSVTREDGKSFTEHWGIGPRINISVSPKGINFFASMYSVSKTVKTGEAMTCHGKVNDTVCVWWRTAYTYVYVQRYEVKSVWYRFRKRARKKGKRTWAGAPNDKLGSAAICIRNDACAVQGAHGWGTSKPGEIPGGPQKYPFDVPFR